MEDFNGEKCHGTTETRVPMHHCILNWARLKGAKYMFDFNSNSTHPITMALSKREGEHVSFPNQLTAHDREHATLASAE